MESCEAVKAMARPLFLNTPIEAHPLFMRMKENSLGADEARAIALDIHHVVDHFPRFLSAVITSISDYKLRMHLVQNLYCEHGSMDPSQVHVVTYRHFLHALGVTESEIATHQPTVGAVAYVRALLSLCQREHPAEALAALAVIEEVVARVSPIVGRWGLRHGAHTPDAENHFGVHEVLDLSHAEEIYALADHFLGTHEDAVRRGLSLGMYYQRRLYSDLVEAHLTMHQHSAGLR